MNSSSLGAKPGGFLCRHKLSSQCALHKHHNLNNRGIRQEMNTFKTLIDFSGFCGLENRFFRIGFAKFGKIDFHYAGEVTHPNQY